MVAAAAVCNPQSAQVPAAATITTAIAVMDTVEKLNAESISQGTQIFTKVSKNLK